MVQIFKYLHSLIFEEKNIRKNFSNIENKFYDDVLNILFKYSQSNGLINIIELNDIGANFLYNIPQINNNIFTFNNIQSNQFEIIFYNALKFYAKNIYIKPKKLIFRFDANNINNYNLKINNEIINIQFATNIYNEYNISHYDAIYQIAFYFNNIQNGTQITFYEPLILLY